MPVYGVNAERRSDGTQINCGQLHELLKISHHMQQESNSTAQQSRYSILYQWIM